MFRSKILLGSFTNYSFRSLKTSQFDSQSFEIFTHTPPPTLYTSDTGCINQHSCPKPSYINQIDILISNTKPPNKDQ